MDEVSVVIPCLWSNEDFFTMTIESLKTLRKDVQIVIIADKKPYAVNVNNGINATTGQYIVITNNDITYLQPDWLEQLVQPLFEGYDIASIRTTDSDGWTTEERYEENAKFGSLWAAKRSVFETIGVLDESFKGYFTDLDFRKRAMDAGLKIVKNHAGLVEHIGKATYSKTDPKDTEFLEMRQRFIDKWGYIE